MKITFVTLLSFMAILFTSCSPKAPAMAPAEDPYEDSIKAENADQAKSNGWEVKRYVDEFGDPTGNIYIEKNEYGTFSNSATTNSDLTVNVMVDSASIKFIFYEYGSHQKKGDGFLTFKCKTEDGKIEEFRLYNPENGYLFLDGREADFRKFFFENTKIKCSCKDNSESGEYHFQLNTQGLKEVMTKEKIPF